MKWTMEINIDTILDSDIGIDIVVMESQNYVYVVINSSYIKWYYVAVAAIILVFNTKCAKSSWF